MPQPLDYRPNDAPANSPRVIPQRDGHVRHITRAGWRRVALGFLVLVFIWWVINLYLNYGS